VRKTTLNELHRPFYGYAFTGRDQNMDMIRHNHELMNLKLFVIPIREKRSQEQICHSFRLKQSAAAVRAGRYEISV